MNGIRHISRSCWENKGLEISAGLHFVERLLIVAQHPRDFIIPVPSLESFQIRWIVPPEIDQPPTSKQRWKYGPLRRLIERTLG